MAQIRANGIDIEYEATGPASGEAVLMIGGLGTQLISWPESLIDGLVAEGFRVIVFDNRDSGLSAKFGEWGPADIAGAFARARAKEPVPAPYTLEDMADDAAGLLDALGIARAHVVGSSNGGAIAQIFAIRHPAKTASLVSIMATSGRRGLPRPSAEAQAWLNKPRNPAGTREGFVEEALESSRIIGSTGFPRDEAAIRERAGRLYDRSFYPEGHGRHLLASIASADGRVAKLGSIEAPTLVLHGAVDPLVPLGQAEDVAKSIPGARMEVIDGMGHDYPEPAIPRIVKAIAANAARARD